jgi:YfiH family protein
MIRAGNLGRLAGLRHGFMTREGGVSEGLYASLNCGLGSGDDAARVAENRARAAARLGLEAGALCTAYQVHGTAVQIVDAPWPVTDRPRVDAMISATPGVALGVLTADCAPVLMADPEAGVVGAVHAGWKGALAGVVETAVTEMAKLGARRERIVAAVGPCIAQASYEVGPEFPAPFLNADATNAGYFEAATRQGHFQFDLAGYVLAKLAAAGVEAHEHVDHDTRQDEKHFFSYRRACLNGERDYGRALSAIALVG